MSTSPPRLLSDWLKKKGTKFGFWHKRYCILSGTRVTLSKDEQACNPDRIIQITQATRIEFIEEDKHPRFVIFPEDDRPVCLAHDSLDIVRKWVHLLRNLTLTTPNLDMSAFELVTTLGRGYYGKVMLCKKIDTGEYFAIKTVHKARLVKTHKVHTIFNERNALMKARHPFIVGFAFSFQTESKVYLGLEYVAGGELFHHLQQVRRIPLPDVRIYIAELSLAINFLHVQGIIYRDLKPENLLIDAQGHIKMTDFGLVKQLDADEETTSTFCGTSEYLAPELVARRPYGMKIDWWALGILTFELLFGQSPFYRPNKARMFEAIRTEPVKFPGRVDSIVSSFISILLEKDPEIRADFAKVRVHPFFAGLDFERVLAREMRPSYVPTVSEHGIKNFDKEFTAEKPMDSFATPARQAHDDFAGFSFVDGGRTGGGGRGGDKESSSEGEEASSLTPTHL
jgi:serine/threonine protein kinase